MLDRKYDNALSEVMSRCANDLQNQVALVGQVSDGIDTLRDRALAYVHRSPAFSEEEEDVAADIFKYDIPAMPVVDEHGTLLGIVTTDVAWDAIEEDVSDDKMHVNALMVVGIALAALLFLALYTLVLFQIIGYTWS